MYHSEKVNHSIWCLDTGYLRPNCTASYCLLDNQELALFDCGVNSSSEIIIKQLEKLGFCLEQVRALFITHAHLDHAGGAGKLINRLPNATVYGQVDAIANLTTPDKLEKGVRSLYGDDFFDRIYGEIFPLDSNRCKVLEDSEEVMIGNCKVSAIYTPGHAWHHHSYFIDKYNVVVAGDAFGMSYQALNGVDKSFCFPITPPSQFKPVEMIQSYDRLVETRAELILLTHYGSIKNISFAYNQLCAMVNESTDLALNNLNKNNQELYQLWLDLFCKYAKQVRSDLTIEKVDKILSNDLKLCYLGAIHWAKKQ